MKICIRAALMVLAVTAVGCSATSVPPVETPPATTHNPSTTVGHCVGSPLPPPCPSDPLEPHG